MMIKSSVINLLNSVEKKVLYLKPTTVQEAAEGEIYIDCEPAGESDETVQALNVSFT